MKIKLKFFEFLPIYIYENGEQCIGKCRRANKEVRLPKKASRPRNE